MPFSYCRSMMASRMLVAICILTYQQKQRLGCSLSKLSVDSGNLRTALPFTFVSFAIAFFDSSLDSEAPHFRSIVRYHIDLTSVDLTLVIGTSIIISTDKQWNRLCLCFFLVIFLLSIYQLLSISLLFSTSLRYSFGCYSRHNRC